MVYNVIIDKKKITCSSVSIIKTPIFNKNLKKVQILRYFLSINKNVTENNIYKDSQTTCTFHF